MRVIRVQAEAFNIQQEYDALCAGNRNDGAVVFFVGRVRDMNNDEAVTSLHLEHYPGMTEKTLASIAQRAAQRWPLSRIRVVHRYGDLYPADDIVFVGVSSPHRQAAFDGASFIMDHLKTEATFWKKEKGPKGSHWVESRDSDQQRLARWQDD
nr:molybdopterin synthase catalytic subunit MoaE [Saccharospirillum mangrovi]